VATRRRLPRQPPPADHYYGPPPLAAGCRKPVHGALHLPLRRVQGVLRAERTAPVGQTSAACLWLPSCWCLTMYRLRAACTDPTACRLVDVCLHTRFLRPSRLFSFSGAAPHLCMCERLYGRGWFANNAALRFQLLNRHQRSPRLRTRLAENIAYLRGVHMPSRPTVAGAT